MKRYCVFFLLLSILFVVVSCPADKDDLTEEPVIEESPEEENPPEEEKPPVKPSSGIETAAELVRDMGLGVNIGNTLDSVSETAGQIIGETGWGNPRVTQNYIKALKTHGFKTVRLPVTWADYIGPAPTYTIHDTWMTRVETVVNWILEEDLYCILNIHHDGADIANKSWIEDLCLDDEEEAKRKFSAVWKQIVVRFKDASEKLVFEGMNEPQFDKLWNRYQGGQAAQKAEAFRLLNMLNQTFVNTVRVNSAGYTYEQYRFLLVSGYWTDIDQTSDPLFQMPTDTIPNRLILSLHYYTPWNFCGGNSTTWTDTNGLNNQFNKVKNNFLDKGIPVIIGEYGVNININSGAVNANPKNSTDRRNWLRSVTQKCVDLGVCPVLWDTGMRNNNKGMADLQRSSPFNISDDLNAVLDSIVWPSDGAE